MAADSGGGLPNENNLALVKSGAGMLTLSGNNTYSGGTTISSGILQLGSATALGASTAPLVINGGTLDLNTNNPTLGALCGAGGTITDSGPAGTSTVTVNQSGAGTFSGSISDGSSRTLALVMAGSGTLSLNGSNAYSGGTTISAGVLSVRPSGNLGTNVGGNNVQIGGGAVLLLSASGNLGSQQAVVGNSSSAALAGLGLGYTGPLPTVIDNGLGGVLGINLANYSTPINLSLVGSGAWFLGSQLGGTYTASSLGHGSGNLYRLGGGGATLTLSQANVLTGTSGVLVGSVAQAGSGTVVFSSSQNYSGTTTVNRGTLEVDGALASLVTVNSGGNLAGTGSLTIVTVNAGGQIAPGNPLGVMHVSGSLNLELGAVMHYDLDTPSTSSEVLMPTGELILGGQPVFDFTCTASVGEGTYPLIAADSIDGAFVSSSRTIDGYPATVSEHGNEIVLTVVREPSTLALLVAGAIGLIGYGLRWRRLPPVDLARNNLVGWTSKSVHFAREGLGSPSYNSGSYSSPNPNRPDTPCEASRSSREVG